MENASKMPFSSPKREKQLPGGDAELGALFLVESALGLATFEFLVMDMEI